MDTHPRAKRHSLYFLSVFDGRTGDLLGQLADISHEGVSILGKSPLRPPETRRLRILLPQQGRPDRSLEFEAESRWSAPDPESGDHTTGFHIAFLTGEQQGLIDQLIHEFGYSRISDVKVTVSRHDRSQAAIGPVQRFLRALFLR